ncbi:hypothetical protein AALO_G00196310 [Alosa alosa]|uniref:Uncharacterized protein n=1 Tax=Alosa alosa TaxID=278164 RepID=A0AAV6G1C5_9TELE|nr:hypothetical protein AALO_G00196310 [Alosa alosa]
MGQDSPPQLPAPAFNMRRVSQGTAVPPQLPPPALNVQRTEELCAVRKNMVTRSARTWGSPSTQLGVSTGGGSGNEQGRSGNRDGQELSRSAGQGAGRPIEGL